MLHADRIYVLERGQIVESGRHEELIERKGLYYAMWRQQVGKNAPCATDGGGCACDLSCEILAIGGHTAL